MMVSDPHDVTIRIALNLTIVHLRNHFGGNRDRHRLSTKCLVDDIMVSAISSTTVTNERANPPCRFDTVYEDDLPGFVAVKTQFWDNGHPDVEVYVRRRTVEGEWIWLATKVVAYIDDPVEGVIVEEVLAEDEEAARLINRITRITAILMQAVETARHEAAKKDAFNANSGTLPDANDHVPNPRSEAIPLVADDALAYQSWLREASGKAGVDLANASDPLQQIMAAAAKSGQVNVEEESETDDDDPIRRLQKELMKGEGEGEEPKGFDPLSALKAVRTGTRLDLGMINLSQTEIKMITIVLTGRIPIEELGPTVFMAMSTPGQTLELALSKFTTDSEVQASAPSSPGHDGSRSSKGPGRRSKGAARQRGAKPFGMMDIQTFGSPGVASVRRPNPQVYEPKSFSPAPITVVNLSYTYMGNPGMEMLGEILYVQDTALETLDISFCRLEEKGILALCRALTKRKRRGVPPLKGLLVSGNFISYRAAKDLGSALSPADGSKGRKRSKIHKKVGTGYEEESESDDDDDDDVDLFGSSSTGKRQPTMTSGFGKKGKLFGKGQGLQVLHLASASLTGEALFQLLQGLGPLCPVQELSVASNNIGPTGATMLVEFLETKGAGGHPVMPYLDRLDLSNNDLGNDGTAKLTRAISKRVKVHFVDLRLSNNEIGPGGIETIMNKLLQHKIVSLSLDKNAIGDQGCQLVAASLQSMHHLSRLNLCFNQIGSRGVNTLMRTLVGCESITYLGLSGNIMKISGAIAMGFTLAQHPRLEELALDNCCLSQAAQCHIVTGIISNRWVPMKRLNGFQAGPPMAAIGALDVFAHNLSNEECFRIRRDEQMKTILQWMESNRAARQNGRDARGFSTQDGQQYLTPDFVSSINEVHGTPSQNAYLRMLGWLSRIPFDEDELTSLRKYFYDADGGEGDRGSDGYINLKLRGDLLAALDSGVADEIRDAIPVFEGHYQGSVGLDLDTMVKALGTTTWETLRGNFSDKMPRSEFELEPRHDADEEQGDDRDVPEDYSRGMAHSASDSPMGDQPSVQSMHSEYSTQSKQSVQSESERSTMSTSGERRSKIKPRITMFPAFEAKLEELKATAKEMMDYEDDPEQQDIILTQYAEASLTILRQLKYHCMHSGLDGWRQGGLRRKVLIVDDSLVTRKMVSRAFEKANFIVDTAENGVEGVMKLKKAIYDIAFMDIDMPVMNGFEATKALRQWEDAHRPGARQPICALTAAYVDDFERSELMKFKEAGLDVMESKPCNIPRLFKVVDDVSPMFSDLSISVSQASAS